LSDIFDLAWGYLQFDHLACAPGMLLHIIDLLQHGLTATDTVIPIIAVDTN